MSGNLFFSSLVKWLGSTEMFARPSKQLPGKWRMIEFYTEPSDGLLNFKEEEIKQAGYVWEVTFGEQGHLHQKRSLPGRIVVEAQSGKWNVSQNFVALSVGEFPELTEEFQFAIEKGILKLLKKDVDGRIQFFGFFSRMGNK